MSVGKGAAPVTLCSSQAGGRHTVSSAHKDKQTLYSKDYFPVVLDQRALHTIPLTGQHCQTIWLPFLLFLSAFVMFPSLIILTGVALKMAHP